MPPHTVGVRIMLDTNSTGADGPFAVNGGVVATETSYGGGSVPDDWFQIDQWPNPTKVARCQLRDTLGAAPTDLVLGTWIKAYGTPPEWGYSGMGEDITGDGAAIMWWIPVWLDPGETVTCAIRFGAGTLAEAGIWDFIFHDPTRDTWLRGRFTPPQVQYDWPGGSSGVLDVGSRLTHHGDRVSCRWLGPAGRIQFAGRIGVDICQGSYSGAPHSSQLCIDPWGVEP